MYLKETEVKIGFHDSGNFGMKQSPRSTDIDPLGKSDVPLSSDTSKVGGRLYVSRTD